MMPKLTIFVYLLAITHTYVSSQTTQKSEKDCLTCVNLAEPYEYPYMVSLQYGIPETFPLVHFCSGSILSEYYILTAATCIETVEGSQRMLQEVYAIEPEKVIIEVVAGVLDLGEHDDTVQKSVVEKSYKHELWNGKPLNYIPFPSDELNNWKPGPYDVAILKLKTPLRLNRSVAKIRLPEKDIKPVGLAVVPSGWNPTIESIGLVPFLLEPKILKTIFTKIIPEDECEKIAKSFFYLSDDMKKVVLHKTSICTRPLNTGVSTCNVDAGGPLVKKGRGQPDEIIGIATCPVPPCCKEISFTSAPIVFVQVSSVIEWIEKIVTPSVVMTQMNRSNNLAKEL